MNRKEYDLINQIANRAMFECGIVSSKLTLLMDIECAHIQFGLRLAELLKANQFEFAHDVYGIVNNINRKTKQVENCFIPRFSKG